MKKYLFLAATAMMFAACTNNEVDGPKVTTTETQQAVGFDVYTANATRAGNSGVQTTATLKAAVANGFGVFASHHAGSHTPTVGPNFMYNEHVYWNDAWTYAPLKYWPNETGSDSQSATSTDVEYLSFFAYAPWVSEGSGTEGITGLSAKDNTTNSPYVQYAVSTNPANSVDLLWGVAPSGDLEYKNVTGGTTKVDKGMPLTGLLKPDKDQKIKFLFKHALSRISFTVVGAFDQIAAGGEKDASTKITVKQIDVYGKDQIGVSGNLCLKNTSANEAYWTATTKWDSDDPLFTISGDMLNKTIKFADDVWNALPEGVTSAEKNVLEVPTNYYMVIPTGSTNITVKIDYYVQTKDDKLAGSLTGFDGSRIENVITKTVSVDLKNNKAYNLKLILGLTSVKLDAEVADWEVDGSTEVNLPRNNE